MKLTDKNYKLSEVANKLPFAQFKKLIVLEAYFGSKAESKYSRAVLWSGGKLSLSQRLNNRLAKIPHKSFDDLLVLKSQEEGYDFMKNHSKIIPGKHEYEFYIPFKGDNYKLFIRSLGMVMHSNYFVPEVTHLMYQKKNGK